MEDVKKVISGILIISLLISGLTITEKKEVKAATLKENEWNMECINAQNSYEDSKKCSRIKVAVLDSGLDYDDDVSCIEQKDFLGEEEINGIYQDLTGHGTCISGIICSDENSSRITGLAANVDLYMARVLDEDNEADINRVVEAIKWAIDKKVHIIHMSFGIKTYSKALNDVVQEAYNKGILMIAAAGNDGTADENESTIEYPAALDNVIAVGCTNEKNKKSDFSSSGRELDVVAPGEKILSTGCFGGVVVEEGTSLAAAQVTGMAAVLWGMHPEKSNTYIREWIISSEYIKTMKKALYMADTISKIKGMGSHPCFHGKGNYIAHTQYLFRMYYEFMNAYNADDGKDTATNVNIPVEWLDYQTVYKGNSELYNSNEKSKENIKAELEKAEKSIYRKILGKKESQWTNDKKAYVMLGLAIHNATDAFSHCAYKKIKVGNKTEW